MPRASLDRATLDTMWAIFSTYYADVTRETFEADLAAKEDVILLRRAVGGSVQGFSTLATFTCTVWGKRVVGVFSGDTIVAKEFWRQTALQRAFVSYVMKVKLRNLHRPVYWFLVSKGFRTYLLLARNFPDYWPRWDKATPAWEEAVIDAFARARYPQAWAPERGILHFAQPSGRLRQEIAPVDDRARMQAEVQFFERRNPNAALGDELCCIGRVDSGLWTNFTLRVARRFARQALRVR